MRPLHESEAVMRNADGSIYKSKTKRTMKEKINDDASWKEILIQLGIGAAMGTAFLLLVCCGDALARFISGQ